MATLHADPHSSKKFRNHSQRMQNTLKSETPVNQLNPQNLGKFLVPSNSRRGRKSRIEKIQNIHKFGNIQNLPKISPDREILEATSSVGGSVTSNSDHNKDLSIE